MNAKHIKTLLKYIVLSVGVLPVCWALWSMICGALMPLNELQSAIAPALSKTGELVKWPLLPAYPTLQPTVELLLDSPEFFVMYWNSIFLVAGSVLGQLFVAAPAAWAVSRLRFKGRRQIYLLYVLLMLMPFQVTMVPNYLMINQLNIMDSFGAIILPFSFSAFPVFIMAKGFDSVPISVLEAARVDGAGQLRTFLHLGLPLGLPGILSALVLGFLESWNAIEQPMLFLKTPSLWPLSLYLPQIATERLGVAMVSSLVMLIPAGLIFMFGQKYLVLGIQSAGIKE